MDKIRFITLEELLEMKTNKTKFRLIDVLPDELYKDGHIPGAIHIPVNQLIALASEHLKKTDIVVVYCGSYACTASTQAATILMKLGYKRVLDFKAGKKAWVQAGLDLEP